jgi:fructoselysine 6-kinase
MKICAMTCCTVDIYPQKNLAFVGGNAVNLAIQCRMCGLTEVSVLGAAGQDRYESEIRRRLENRQIDASHFYRLPGKTASNRIYINEQGDRYFLPDSWDGGVYADYRLTDEDWAFANAHHLVSMVTVDENFTAALTRLNAPVLLHADFLDTRNFDLLESNLDRIDIAFFSGDEEVVERAKSIARSRTAFIVVTLGAQGSVALRHDQVLYQPALPVSNIVDTTGCGDAFQAAFVCSWYRHYNLQQALLSGSQAAADTLAHLGGFEGSQIEA